MKGLILALQFLTRLPMPAVSATEAEFARAIRWFPAAGLVVGGCVAGAAWLGLQIDGWTGALFALFAWVAISGALHLDGLADITDASGAAHGNRARLSAVLADSHVGSFGAAAITLQCLAKLVLTHSLLTGGAATVPLILIPCAARLGPLVWTRWLPPLHQGLATRFRGGLTHRHVLGWSLALLAAALVFPALVVLPLLTAAWGVWLKRKIGGISGDGHGAGIELCETGLLLAAVIGSRMA